MSTLVGFCLPPLFRWGNGWVLVGFCPSAGFCPNRQLRDRQLPSPLSGWRPGGCYSSENIWHIRTLNGKGTLSTVATPDFGIWMFAPPQESETLQDRDNTGAVVHVMKRSEREEEYEKDMRSSKSGVRCV